MLLSRVTLVSSSTWASAAVLDQGRSLKTASTTSSWRCQQHVPIHGPLEIHLRTPTSKDHRYVFICSLQGTSLSNVGCMCYPRALLHFSNIHRSIFKIHDQWFNFQDIEAKNVSGNCLLVRRLPDYPKQTNLSVLCQV